MEWAKWKHEVFIFHYNQKKPHEVLSNYAVECTEVER